MQSSSAFMEQRVFSILRACMDERQESSYTVTVLQHPLFSSSTTEGEENRYSSCRAGETVSPLFLTFGFPLRLRLQVSLLFLNIKTKAAVRDAAGSWKLGVKSNEDCFLRTGQLLL